LWSATRSKGDNTSRIRRNSTSEAGRGPGDGGGSGVAVRGEKVAFVLEQDGEVGGENPRADADLRGRSNSTLVFR
jgi:hypothetical protein